MRFVLPSQAAFTPGLPDAMRGGQYAVHAPLQLLLPFRSFSNRRASGRGETFRPVVELRQLKAVA